MAGSPLKLRIRLSEFGGLSAAEGVGRKPSRRAAARQPKNYADLGGAFEADTLQGEGDYVPYRAVSRSKREGRRGSKDRQTSPPPALPRLRRSNRRPATESSQFGSDFVSGQELEGLEAVMAGGGALGFGPSEVLARQYFDARHVVRRFESGCAADARAAYSNHMGLMMDSLATHAARSISADPRMTIRAPAGVDLSFEREVREEGFRVPLLIEQPKGLGLKVPRSHKVDVDYVAERVGYDREFEVIDVSRQHEARWPMYKWVAYFASPLASRTTKHNVISLEFSDTPLASEVQAPRLVRELDWIDRAWPHPWKAETLHHIRTGPEVPPGRWRYPKVQKYCLMSVAGCYTDFHIDFGGSSVWYHLVRGRKLFFLIPPSPDNLKAYSAWASSPAQSSTFFADKVSHCFRLEVVAGNTLLIPSGWIHAVYTPDDSIVFGGNFLHSYAATMQMRISEVESATAVPSKYQVPFYQELLWHALSHLAAQAEADCRGRTEGTPPALSLWEIAGGLALHRFLASQLRSALPLSAPLPAPGSSDASPTAPSLSHSPGVADVESAVAASASSATASAALNEAHRTLHAAAPFPQHDYARTLDGSAINALAPTSGLAIRLSLPQGPVKNASSPPGRVPASAQVSSAFVEPPSPPQEEGSGRPPPGSDRAGAGRSKPKHPASSAKPRPPRPRKRARNDDDEEYCPPPASFAKKRKEPPSSVSKERRSAKGKARGDSSSSRKAKVAPPVSSRSRLQSRMSRLKGR